jgi:DNA mismatch repair protein MutH
MSSSVKPPKCPKGTRRNKLTGNCEPTTRKRTLSKSKSKSSSSSEKTEATATAATSKKQCIRPTIAEVMDRLQPYINVKIHLPKTPNKGMTGFLLEKYAGIPTSSDCLDCIDGEVKSFPVKIIKKTGAFVPKETIAITMLDRDNLKTSEWEGSRCAKKMQRILYIPYHREGEYITIGNLILIDACEPAVAAAFTQIKDDYKVIKKLYEETETLTSATGKYLQNRTKGPGHGSTSRAYYLRPLGVMALLEGKSFFTNTNSGSSSHVSE